MKYFCLFVIHLFVVAISFGQTTLLNSNCFSIGQMVINSNCDTTVTEGTAGSNQTWDFSTVISHGRDTSLFVDPINSPYFSNFQNSNIASSSLSNPNYYTYYKLTNDSLIYLGFGGINGTSPIINVYSSPLDLLVFPLNYNDTFSYPVNSFSKFAYSSTPGDTLYEYGYGNSQVVVDGWGTLITPNNQVYPNTLRLKKIMNSTDSVVYTGAINTTTVNSGVTTTYSWYSTDIGDHGSQFYISYTPFGNNLYKSVGWQRKTITSVLSYASNEVKLSLNPNPANDILYLKWDNELHIPVEIYNLLGVCVLKTVPSNQIDISNLSDGIYILKAIMNEQTIARRFEIVR